MMVGRVDQRDLSHDDCHTPLTRVEVVCFCCPETVVAHGPDAGGGRHLFPQLAVALRAGPLMMGG